MKYGMRERISGAIILLALAVIFIPMLFDEPPSREERPEPVLTIEQPIEVERLSVDEPTPPDSLGQIQPPRSASQPISDEASRAPEVAETEPEGQGEEPPAQATTEESRDDPIAELARGAQQNQQETQPQQPRDAAPQSDSSVANPQGWAVQVGSYAEAENAERQEQELSSQGFSAFRRSRDNDLTTVYVGPFDSSEAGEEARTELKNQANIQGLLVRLREGE